MSWYCSECTYLNRSDQKICEICGQGYRFLSTRTDQNESNGNDNDSVISADDINTTETTSTSTIDDTNESNDEDSLLESSATRKDMYIRHDGDILYGQAAMDERKRSIARRKALDIQKAWQSSRKPTASSTDSSFSTHFFGSSCDRTSTARFSSASSGHFSALNANIKGAHASATATAEAASASALNLNVTGANASLSASANAVRANAFNTNVTGVNASASATADLLKASVGNVNVTGVETAASASASLAKVNVGNVSVTGASAGASVNVNGTGVSAFNACISGPSAAASVNVDGGLSFGNVSLGLRPALDIGFGLNIGIPFLSGSSGSSGDNNGGNNQNGENSGDGNPSSDEPRGMERYQQSLSQRFPNQRHYLRAAEFNIKPNTSSEAIDPTLTDKRIERSDQENDRVNAAVSRHNELIDEGQQFAGFKGGPKRDANGNLVTSSSSNPTTAPAPSDNSEWSGMYTSASPEVAAGYAMDDQGRPGQIDRVYLPQGSADSYYTPVGLNTRIGLQALRDVKEHSNGRYIFSGPQHDTDPDLCAPETVIAPAVCDEAFRSGNIRYVPSAHEIDNHSYRLDPIHNRELDASKMFPDYLVHMTKGPDDCARDGGRERLAHTFDGRPPYLYETKPPKKTDLTDDDKLLMEECQKLGFEIPPGNLHDWKKNLRSNEEYEREEDERMRQAQNSSAEGGASSKSTKEEDESESDKPPEPCKDHPPHIRCMNCLKQTSGARIRNIQGRIHGFKFK